MIELVNYSEEFQEKCFALELKDEQKNFVDLPSESIPIALKIPKANPMVIKYDNEVCGVIIYESLDAENKSFLIWDFMIDKKFQNKGIGRKTMEIVLDKITSVSTAKRIEIAYEPENVIVKDLYLSFGFEDTNIKNSDGEFIMFKELKKMEE